MSTTAQYLVYLWSNQISINQPVQDLVSKCVSEEESMVRKEKEIPVVYNGACFPLSLFSFSVWKVYSNVE